MKNKLVAFTLSACLALGTLTFFAGCGEEENVVEQGGNNGGSTATRGFTFNSELLSEMDDPANDYNSNLFYVNSLEFHLADPSVIYITEGEDAGYFYAYGTSDDIGCHGVQAWRSKDLSHWECTGVAFHPDFSVAWATDNYWAPEVIYDEGVYYMFYNAYNQNDNNRLCISVAWAESPSGPFYSPNSLDGNGDRLTPSQPVFDVTVRNKAVADRAKEMEAQGITRFAKDNALDASPFVDPVSGKKYLFFSYYDSYGEGSFVYGMEMKDWYTPDYSTLTRLTHPGHSTVEHGLSNTPSDRYEANVNEGPFMIYHEGTYYLTLSIYGYTDPQYRVIQAVADSPLGTFVKLSDEEGGKVISTDVANWDHIVSAGHHCFITVGDELFIAYHTFYDRMTVVNGRALAFDKVIWTENSSHMEVLHTNGPSWSVQPLPASLSGYKNLAPQAHVTADNTEEGSDTALLTDGLVKYQEYDLVEEYQAKAGKSTITLEWDDFKTVRGLLVYNSWDFYSAFDKIEKVEMEYKKADGSTGTVTINNLAFDEDWHVDSEYEMMRPGGAAIAEFNELPVKKITFTINSKDLKYTMAEDYDIEESLALGEIVVLGKDAAIAGISDFGAPYTFTNPQHGSAKIIRDSATFGTVPTDETHALETMYGYDLSHDDGTADAYIEQTGARDQYAYFKGIYSTEFYAEAEFSVISEKSYANDQWPKFGIAITCNEEMAANTIFYYIDADPAYAVNRRVGAAQRAVDNSDWFWGQGERLADAPGIAYSHGEYTKLAVLRKGKTFYFLCNDEVKIVVDDFFIFTDNQSAGVGFLTFNTPMRVKNYMATADSAKIAEKATALGISFE